MDLSLLYFDPIRMVVLNIAASSVLIGGTLFYKYIYPKKTISKTIFCVFLSILPIISMFRSGSYESGDMVLHAARAASFYNSLSEGIIIPQWYSEANATYGYPLFIFAYPLPYYIISLYHFLGLGFINSVKLLLISTHLLSGIFMYLLLKQHLSKNASLVGAIFFLFAPYHLIDMHFRVSIGELTALMIFPLTLILLKRYILSPSPLKLFISSLSIALMTLSHQAVSLIGLPLLFLYGIFIQINYAPTKVGGILSQMKRFSFHLQTKVWSFHSINAINVSTKSIIKVVGPFTFGLLISAYYWIPILTEIQYTHWPLYSQTIRFYPISSFLYSTWRFGLLLQGSQGEFVTNIGYVQITIIIYAFYSLVTGRIKNNLKFMLTSLLIVLFLYLMMTNKISSPVWEILRPLKNMQFSYRLMSMVIFITAAIAAVIYENIKTNLLFYLLIVLASIPTLLNWGNRGMDTTVNESLLPNYEYIKKKGGIVKSSSATPKWADPHDPWQKEIPEKHLEAIEGKANIIEVSRNSISHKYNVRVYKPTAFKENTYYFPGWKLYANGFEKEIIYDSGSHRGIVTFHLPAGSYILELKFQPTRIRMVSLMISTTSLMSLAFILIFKKDSVYHLTQNFPNC
jgi:hypothetical protein